MSKRNTVKSSIKVNVKASEQPSEQPSSALAAGLLGLAERAAPIEPAAKRSGLTYTIAADGTVQPDVTEHTSASGRRTAALLGAVDRSTVERLFGSIASAVDAETKSAMSAALYSTADRVLRLWAQPGRPSVMRLASVDLPKVVAHIGEIEARKLDAKASERRTVEQAREAIETRSLRECAFASAAVNGAIATAVAGLAQAHAVDMLRAVESARSEARSARRRLTTEERASIRATEERAASMLTDASTLAAAAEQASAIASEQSTEASAN